MESRNETYLSFILGDEVFAIKVDKVLEVLENQKITKVPKAPEYINGLINFRGEILPVVNTRIKFNMPELVETDNTVIIVLDLNFNGKQVELGAMADAVKDVVDIRLTEIKSVPDIGIKYSIDYVSGMYKYGDHFIMILDVDKVFSIEELSVKEKIDTEDTL
jgi:purine-binding chemotaxis protein CheW